jgi:hypothetical protein
VAYPQVLSDCTAHDAVHGVNHIVVTLAGAGLFCVFAIPVRDSAQRLVPSRDARLSEPAAADRLGIGFGWLQNAWLLHARLKIHRGGIDTRSVASTENPPGSLRFTGSPRPRPPLHDKHRIWKGWCSFLQTRPLKRVIMI